MLAQVTQGLVQASFANLEGQRLHGPSESLSQCLTTGRSS